jgi:branched-chain amino acid transport system permease protein
METLLQQLVNGMALASVYALLAVGITLVFGLTGIVNFAHGEFLVLGGLLAASAIGAQVPFAAACLLAALGAAVVGYGVERFLFRPIATEPIRGFIVSLGLIIAMQHIALKLWGSEQRAIDAPLQQVLAFGEVRISAMRIVVTVATVAVLAAFLFLLARSRWGRALRSVAIDRETAATVGVPVQRYVTSTFVIGSALAGLAGALLLSLFPMSPFSGGSYTIKGFAVAIVGGLGSVSGAMIAAVILGMVEAIAAGYISPTWSNAYAFGAMILVLLLRPGGLRGKGL